MYQRILIPIDGSKTSERALQEAVKLADVGAKLRLVYVLEETYLDADAYTFIDYDALQKAVRQTGERILDHAANKARLLAANVETVLLEAGGERIAGVIDEDAKLWEADLIVIGTHGRSGLSRLLLGSVAEGVVRMSSVPVMLVRNEF